jgi:hypothetical protein
MREADPEHPVPVAERRQAEVDQHYVDDPQQNLERSNRSLQFCARVGSTTWLLGAAAHRLRVLVSSGWLCRGQPGAAIARAAHGGLTSQRSAW